MADRMRDLAKRSGSKLHVSKGSMPHIGTTPYKFRIDVFISFVENIKNASEVCVTWERRGKEQATAVVKVKDSRAVFRQTLSMDSTFFRKSAGGKGTTGASETGELKFDEKKAKFVLRKGTADGKAIGKITMNLADHVKGTTSSQVVHLKLSNDSVIATKVDATLMHMGKKKKKGGSNAGSEACSEMTEANSLENDSLFGDDDRDLGDLEIMATSSPGGASPTASNYSSAMSNYTSLLSQPLSAKSSQNVDVPPPVSMDAESKSLASTSQVTKATKKTSMQSLKDGEELKNSPSLRNKLKAKLKEKKSSKKEKDVQTKQTDNHAAAAAADSTSAKPRKRTSSSELEAQLSEMKTSIESLKRENEKLKSSKQKAMEEIDALRADLEACESALEETEAQRCDSPPVSATTTAGGLKQLQEKDRQIAELQAQNDNLLDELEEMHQGDANLPTGATSGQMKILRKRVEELEIALRREPQYLEVVNELKVAKVSLALAEMEKEQALFALQGASMSPIKSP